MLVSCRDRVYSDITEYSHYWWVSRDIVSCLVYTWDIATEGMSTAKWKGGFSYTLCSRSTVWREGTECWIMKLPLLSNPLSLLCKVWCNTTVHLKQRTQKAQPAELRPALSASDRDSVNVANLRVRHNTKYHTGIQRKGLCHNYTSLFLILSLLHWHQRGGESLCPNVGWWKKNFLCLEKKVQANWRRLSPRWFKNSFRYSTCQS